MTNEPKKKTEEPKAAKAPPPPAAQSFVAAYERYALSVQGVWNEAEKRSQEAGQKIFQEQQQAWSRMASAEPPAPDGKAGDSEQARQGWLREQQESWLESQRRYEEAYRHYVSGLREAWSQGDFDKIDVGSLLTIGQSLQAAAVLAQSTMGAWNVAGTWAHEPPR
jgi:hypothetical protein